MKNTATATSDQQLRQTAESSLLALARTAPPATAEPAAQKLLHELQVYRIELEIQNEALRQSQHELEVKRDSYVDLYEFAPVGYLTIFADGQIEAINLTGAALLGESRSKLLHRRFSHFVVAGEQDDWHRHLLGAFQHASPQRCELRLQRFDGSIFFAGLDTLPKTHAGGASTLRVTITDISARKQAELALRVANQQLEALVAEQVVYLSELAGDLTLAEQRERDRLHGLLHDEIQPLLVATRLSLSGLSVRTPREDCRRVAAESCETIGQVIHMSRTLGQQLSPPLVRDRGLLPALDILCRNVKLDYGLDVEFSAAANAEPEDQAIRLLCFNAVRELLMNVVKHAGETRVRVEVHQLDDAMLGVTVTDFGRGFDTAADACGTGLAVLARRLGMFGGNVHIDSRPGHGTVAAFRVPLRAAGGANWAHGSVDRRTRKA